MACIDWRMAESRVRVCDLLQKGSGGNRQARTKHPRNEFQQSMYMKNSPMKYCLSHHRDALQRYEASRRWWHGGWNRGEELVTL